MDLVGLSLDQAILRLKTANYSYNIKRTFPTRDYFKIDEAQIYVIRQLIEDNIYFLTIAAKMRKEVC